ncbi:FG-GAP-like repeat-containing protein [Streptomyces sp. Go40/10]|uniref:FG-GAP-like repeat-containing protein n=1 Tax=Streptomyces sp. Go40/10 TaxID=2825844 RepID=UPI001E3B8F33|nr:FG-GAP-like repeat-containing protein [Streptomyces sp. Go40/10]UFR02822.1 FG-GAP-like repeat-containing protein [Streptomyces sp. Go40/10]
MFRSRSHARWALPLTLGLTTLGLAAPAVSAAPPKSTPVHDDFNGDGYADLAIGAPNATVGGQARAGYVAVLYGGPHGLSAGHRAIISRATAGVPGDPVKGQGFGLQITKGDLDGDGYADLVTAGVVVWGGPRGLSGGTAIPGNSHQIGDFDGDGRLDLAVIQGGSGMGDDPAGSTAEIWKGPIKRTGTPAARTPLDPEHLQYVDMHNGDTGDINGDGRTDLVLTGYCGDGNNCSQLYLSGPAGLSRVTQPYRSGDGAAAIGDLNGDGYGDLVTGFQDDNAIWVMYGSASGLRGESTWKRFTQDTPGVPGSRESNDKFGQAVAVGDITGDGIDDVAVGVPDENGEGVVDVLRGSRSGLTGAGAQAFGQDTKGVPGTAEQHDAFGYVVRLLDVNGNGHADLAAAAPGEDGGDGAVWVLRGRPSGLVTDAAAVFGGKTVGAPYRKASFGFGLK